MKKIQIQNEELLEVLNDISNTFNSIDKPNSITLFGEPDDNEYYTSEEFLDLQVQTEHDGYGATISHGMDLNNNGSVSLEVNKFVTSIDQRLKPILSTGQSAVKMYYPENGFMHWHNNHNVPGYNILLSYTQNGKGWFRYRDPLTHEIVTMHDEPGWTAKVGYYGSNEEPDKIYWHCARAYEDRFTLGYVIPNLDIWQLMVEDIQDR